MDRRSAIWHRHCRRHLLRLVLLLHGLLLLHLAVALDHRFDNLLRQAQSMQIQDSIGAKMIWQR
ncbi:MAG: hypothetical protein ABSG78_20610 [Verrucomicrobiota bacterium]